MKNVTCVIADDELFSRENIKMMLEEVGAAITILGEAKNGREAIQLINEQQPELVFLDVEMPLGDGFDVLQQVNNRNFELIFVTAYEHFALKAIKESAVDYIVKPIDKTEFSKAFGRAIKAIQKKVTHTNYEYLLENVKTGVPSPVSKVALLVGSVYELVPVELIIRCKSDSNYTEFYLTDKRKLVVSKGLKFYDELLSESGFVRVHQSHLINLHFIQQVEKGKHPQLILTDGTCVEVSLARKAALFTQLGL